MTTYQVIDPRWGKPSFTHHPWLLANFRARPTDVIIATAPKCGTTWMQQILHQLRTGGDDRFESIYDVVPWLEKPEEDGTLRSVLAGYEALDNPRIFKTHCTFEQTPGFGTVRVVLSSRDPRDACVSSYHHTMALTERARRLAGIDRPLSFDEFVDKWIAFGAWYRNVVSWWPQREHPRVLWLRYEDMKKDFDQTVSRLLTFLNWSLDTHERQRVNALCAFDWMKTNDEKFTARHPDGASYFEAGRFIRKGSIGDYQSLMTTVQEEKILAKARDLLPSDCLDYLGLSV